MGPVAPLPFLQRITRDSRPESEISINVLSWTAGTVISTPTSLRTDRKIKTVLFHVRLRLVNNAAAATLRTAPPLLGTQLYSLFQQFQFRGTHLTLGSQTPVVMRGELAAEYMAIFYPNYQPTFSVTNSAGGTNGRNGVVSATNNATIDVDLVLPVPMYPAGITAADIPFYCIHGPDWPGNVYIDITLADASAICSTAVNAPTITGFGGVGNATIEIATERPLLTKPLMSRIRPAVTFRLDQFSQPTQAVQASGTGVTLLDMQVGKDTTRVIIKTGTSQANQSGGVVTYGALSDGIVTRSFISLDNRQMGNSITASDLMLQDYAGRSIGRLIPVGYKLIDFIDTPGMGAANPKAAFQSSTLTAARKFQVQGDVTTVGSAICDIVQEMVYGQPNLLAPAK